MLCKIGEVFGAGILCLGLVSTQSAAHDDEESSAPSLQLSPEQQQIVTFMSDYADAFQSTDLERISDFMINDEGFSFFEGSLPDWGWDSYVHHMQAELPAFSETRYVISGVRPFTSGDMAYATFEWQLDVTVLSDQFEGGRHPVSMRGIGTAVLLRDGDDWRISHLHTSQSRASTTGGHQSEPAQEGA